MCEVCSGVPLKNELVICWLNQLSVAHKTFSKLVETVGVCLTNYPEARLNLVILSYWVFHSTLCILIQFLASKMYIYTHTHTLNSFCHLSV